MDNLEIAPFQLFQFPEDVNGDIIHSTVEDVSSCFITDAGYFYYREYTSNSFTSIALEDNVANSTIQLKCLSVWKVVFLATDADIVIIEPKSEQILTVKSFTCRITHTSWNPTETFLLVVDENNKIYGFTFEYNAAESQYRFVSTHESNIDEAVPNSVYVGWGSQDTQFRGAVKKEEVKVEEIAQDYSPPVISWRGNGEQFIVNYWSNYRRILKLFDANLNPLHESTRYPNLLPMTSFKEQGNFIACAATHDDNNKVVVFEKNCLVKSEFSIPDNKGRVVNLQYHPELPILAVHSEDLDYTYLNIYLYSNAKWYLKQQILYRENIKLKSFAWTCCLNKSVCNLDVITSESITRYLFKFVINRYPEYGMVAVTDGSKVYFTNLQEQIIPPPMASLCMEFPRPVNQILFDGTLGLFQFVTSDDGLVYYHFKDGLFSPHCAADYPDLRLRVANHSRNDRTYTAEVNIRNLKFQLYLDGQQDLVIDARVVCSNVLSMYVHDKYLLFTHASCKLFCVRMLPEILTKPHWDLNQFHAREVEQGTKIVCITSYSSIVMEEPRGNLETITCRVIGIDIVEGLLKANKWDEAMHYIRHQRLNWNLLIDLNPQRFFDHINDFIINTRTVALLNTIVCEFSAENCLETMYKTCVDTSQINTDFDKNLIFVRILDELCTLNPILNLVSIVTLQIKHFTLRQALISLMTIFETGEIDVCKRALATICQHRHIRDVISEAYALYCTNFMTFVYTSAGEDPRSFEPQLKKLEILEEPDRRFQMCVLGKHFGEATKYLIRLSSYNEKYVTDFINKHSTQSVAFENITTRHEKYRLVTRIYATYLSQKGRHDEAAYILERAGLPDLALYEYKYALNWQKVISLLEELKIENEKRTLILTDVANLLLTNNQIDNAVIVLDHYLGKHDVAIQALTERKQFQKALNLAKKHGCDEVVEEYITPAILQYRCDFSDKLLEIEANFKTHSSRLYALRQEKLNNLTVHVEDDDDDDLESEYGSIVSRGSASSRASGSSTASARNRRKQERKKIDIREGSHFEDIAIIRQLYLYTVDIFKMGPELRDISLTLIDDKSFAVAYLLQKKLEHLQQIVMDHIPQIWTDVFLYAQTCTNPEILSVIINREELDEQFRTPPPAEIFNVEWKLSIFDT